MQNEFTERRSRTFRRSSDVAKIHVGFIGVLLSMIFAGLGAYFPIGIQQIITIYEGSNIDVENKSFISLFIISIGSAILAGYTYKFVRERQWVKFSGAILGFNIGYLGFLIAALCWSPEPRVYEVNLGAWSLITVLFAVLILEDYLPKGKPHPTWVGIEDESSEVS